MPAPHPVKETLAAIDTNKAAEVCRRDRWIRLIYTPGPGETATRHTFKVSMFAIPNLRVAAVGAGNNLIETLGGATKVVSVSQRERCDALTRWVVRDPLQSFERLVRELPKN
jgi:hypothetical protein